MKRTNSQSFFKKISRNYGLLACTFLGLSGSLFAQQSATNTNVNSAAPYWQSGILHPNAPADVKGEMVATPYGQIFYRSTNDRIHSMYFYNGGWYWSDLNQASYVGAKLGSGNTHYFKNIAVTDYGQVFYVTTNGEINSLYYHNGQWAWSELNGASGSSVIGGLSISPNGRVYFREANDIACIYYTSSGWVYSDLDNASDQGNIPVGIIGAPDEETLYYKTTTGDINRLTFNGSQWIWEDLNGFTANNMNISEPWRNFTMVGDDKIFYQEGLTDEVHAMIKQNGVWTLSVLDNASTIGGIPSDHTKRNFVAFDNGQMFYISNYDQLFSIYPSGNFWYWSALNPAPNANIGYYMATDRNGQVFYRGKKDNRIYHFWYGNEGEQYGKVKKELRHTVPTKFVEENNKVELEAYPNPSKDGIFQLKEAYHTVRVFDILGHEIEISLEDHKLDLSKNPKGVYLIEALDEKNVKHSSKLIIHP